MTKIELANAIRSVKVSDAIDALPQNGEFSCSIQIHQRCAEAKPKGSLEIHYFPETVIVQGGE